MASVALAFAEGVEPLVVDADERGRPHLIRPRPGRKFSLDLDLLRLCRDGFIVIDHDLRSAAGLRDFVRDAGGTKVQDVFGQLEGVYSPGPPCPCRLDRRPVLRTHALDLPDGECGDVFDRSLKRRNKRDDEIAYDLLLYPRRAEPDADLVAPKVGRQ